MENQNVIKNDRLPIGKFFAWKSRDISLASVAVIMTYLTLYCTDALGMPPALVGGLLMTSKLFDGVTDLFAGYIIDNTKTRLGKARPYELSIIGAWLSTALLFFASPEWSMVIKSIWLFVMYTFVQSVFTTLLNANATPYIIRAFKSKALITKVSSYGGIVSMFGAIVISVSFPILMANLATSQKGWQTLILIYAVPLTLLGLLRFFFIKEEEIQTTSQHERVHFKDVLLMLKTNKYAWILAGVTGMASLITGMIATTYYFKYIVGNMSLMAPLQAVSIFILPIMFIFPRLIKKFGVAKLIALGATIAIVGYILMFFAGSNLVLILIGSTFASMATLPVSYLQAIIITDLATYNEWKGLPRMEATSSIVSGFAMKAFAGVGTGLLGILLGMSGYDGSLAIQSEGTMFMIRALMSLIPMIFMVILMICAIFLSGLEKRMPQIRRELEERSKESDAEIA